MIPNAIVMTLLIVAACLLVGSCAAIVVLVAGLAREAVEMLTDWYRVRAKSAHGHGRRRFA